MPPERLGCSETQTAYRICKKGKPAVVVAAGHKKTNFKKENRMPDAMGLKTVKTFLSSIYSPTRARQWVGSTMSNRGGTAGR